MKNSLSHSRFGLAGKVALVTAGAGGFGQAISLGLAEYGADVVVTDIQVDAAETIAKKIRDMGQRAYSAYCDTMNTEQVEQAVALTVQKLGHIDILINIAGTGILKPATDMAIEEFQAMIDSCLTGTFRTLRASGRAMIKQGNGGSIILMSSISSVAALGRGTGAYAAAKAGVNALVRELAVEWAPYNIRVNALAPCQFKTITFEKFLDNPKYGGREAFTKKLLGNIPLGKFGAPDEIVGPTIFLASNASSMVTGHVLFVDGGYTAR